MRTSRFLSIQCADDAMLRDLLRFDDDFLARAAGMSDAEVLERFHRCPAAFRCVVDADTRTLHGYFILLPLTDACQESIRSGRITSGRQIGLDDLACSTPPAAAYLSVVCAGGAAARAAAVAGCIEALRTMYGASGARSLFVRAATGEGANALERLTGERFVADGKIHEIDLSRYAQIVRRVAE